MSKLNNLLQQAAVIRDATEEHENTAVRVGTMFVDFIQSCMDVLPKEIVDATGISTSASETNFVVRYRTIDDTGSSVSKSITIPVASSDNAGLLSTSLLAEINQAVSSVVNAVSELATVRGIAETAQTTSTRAEGKADTAQAAAAAAKSTADGVAATVEAMKKYGYKFIGVATPTTDPGKPSENVFYLATTEGDYTNFPTSQLSEEGPIHFHLGADEVAILRYTNPTDDRPNITNWSKVTLNLTKGTAITEIRTTIEEKQDKLVSGTNIKTVNGQSMLGQGDVAITSGGGGGANINVVDKVPDALEPGTIYLIKSED